MASSGIEYSFHLKWKAPLVFEHIYETVNVEMCLQFPSNPQKD